MVLFPFLLFILAPAFGAETSSDLVAAESIASDHKAQSVGSGGSAKYGYPYMIAPTLQPQMQARSDDEDKEPLQAKSYGTRNVLTDNDDTELKKNPLKKLKAPYFPIRRQDDEISDERLFRSYREPKYRNFEELEASFLPRRMDINIPYSQYDYSKFGPKLSHSPRDPYLSPSNEPIDSFYPSSPKMKSYSSPSGYGTRNVQPIYGAGNYEDPIDYHAAGLGGGYVGPSSYASDSDPSYPVPDGSALSYPSSGGSVPGYLSSGGSYGYQDYEIKSNEPIMGNIRKKLLDYAGASDLYEGEPDYLQEIARNKHKYGSIGNDYYAYGGPGYRDSYRDFPYVESKISLIKKSRRV